MFDAPVETLPWDEQSAGDDKSYRRQVDYLLSNSPFFRAKLGSVGIDRASDAGGLDRIAMLPLTDKSELQASRTPDSPFGAHCAVGMKDIVRIYSTSGTTGVPSYIPLTKQDLENWITTSARSYSASGIGRGDGVITTYNAGPFVAGAALGAFDRLGVRHIPLGTGNTDRLVKAISTLAPKAVVMTPSYASYIAEWATDHKFDLEGCSVERIMVAGEPGGGEPRQRQRLQASWGAKITEAMGIGDVGPSLWGECEHQCGMHLGARGFVHVELIDPGSGLPVSLADEARGELVLTHLLHQAAPLLRFRTRDHVQVWTSKCRCGRTAPRVRCIGRTDDMLIVRGVNVFPSALREVAGEFAPTVSGNVLVRPASPGVSQAPPLPVDVELAKYQEPSSELAERIAQRMREALAVSVRIALVPFGSLERSEYKSKLIQR